MQVEAEASSLDCSSQSSNVVGASASASALTPTVAHQDDSSLSSKPQGPMFPDLDEPAFYDKLRKLHDPSQPSLHVEVGDAVLDLYLLYKEVTMRGGFLQVSRDGKWAEVASALKLTNRDADICLQLHDIYKQILYRFELICLLEMLRKSSGTYGVVDGSSPINEASVDPGAQLGKTVIGMIETEFNSGYLITVMVGSEKLDGFLCHIDESAGKQFAVIPNLMEGVGPEDHDSQPVGMLTAIQEPSVQSSSKHKGRNKDPNAPRRPKNAYQIFLTKECNLLKKIHGGRSGKDIRKMANDAWKCLSESDRQPYIEESRRDKERYDQEMDAYKNAQTRETENKPHSQDAAVDDAYHVSLQTEMEPNDEFLVPEESMVELALQMMEGAQQNMDSILQFSWDEFCGRI
uniref:Uncharacterized protein n=1 Tax=Nelumbo nucifera TaxID=4432 RepID=A0A822Z4H6_NELNU|nr:TPA_asm: hypothetical protein HUJ06_015557 [Nelumbo nucifera]